MLCTFIYHFRGHKWTFRGMVGSGGVGGPQGGSLQQLAPSPCDSGVSELEAALRDRDSELAHLRQTMEHNEQVIFRLVTISKIIT